MDPRRGELLRLNSAPPALYGAGRRGRKTQTATSSRVLFSGVRELRRTAGGARANPRKTEIPLLGQEVLWRSSVPSFGPADLVPGHFHPTPMRDTRRLDILVPVFDNDGLPFTDHDFLPLEDLLIRLAGGFTRRPDVTGVWQSPDGRVFRDSSRSYTVTVPIARAEDVATRLSRFIVDRFRQEAALVEATPTMATVF